jgi:adenosine deaminase
MRELPKIELHLHHEGAAPPAFIRGLAQEKGVDISGVFAPDGGYAYKDFWHFLTVYETATSVLNTPEDYARLTRAVLEESAANGVVYSETFLSPDFCGGGDVEAWREYLTAIREEAERAEAELGITLRGIVTCIRHFGPDRARPIAQCAAETAGDWLVGFGMAGDELKGKPGDFLWAFDCAREAGFASPSMRANGAGRPRSATRSMRSTPSGSAMACRPSRTSRWWTGSPRTGSCWNAARAPT